MQTYLTQIQRFSLSDGPGIRTTVFFKGCNMRCSWCHNPETLSAKPELLLYETKCIGCGKCIEVCPTGAQKVENGKHVIDRALCTACGKCAENCYAEALVLCGRQMSVEDVMAEIMQDAAYYKSSNGGVTLSGGEVLCHTEFAAQVLARCKEAGIHTAIETNLNFPFASVESFLQMPDLIMCDLKIMDDAAHREHTAASNRHVIENIEEIEKMGKPYIVRTPLIPDVTDTEENIRAIAQFLKGRKNLVRYELLNFNPLGAGKYESLSAHNAFAAARPLGAERLAALEAIVRAEGVAVKVV